MKLSMIKFNFRRLWKSYGVQIAIATSDITTKSGCAEQVQIAANLGPVGGFFSLATTIANHYFDKITSEQFGSVFPSKVHSALYFDEITRESCPHLDYFLVFSSVASARGAAIQSNYAMTNSLTERLVEKRQSDGFCGQAIQWGPVSGTGLMEDNDKVSFHGLEMQPITSCMEEMDHFLTSSECVMSSTQFPYKTITVGTENKESAIDFLFKMLGLDISNVDDESILSDIGVDSMLATEIRQVLCRDYKVNLTLKEVRSKKLSEMREIIT